MLRIHFTADDLMRTRVGAADPMWEIALSLHMLRTRPAAFGQWRRQVRPGLPSLVRMLCYLSPPHGNFADFLTPEDRGHGLDSGVSAVLSTPRSQILADLEDLGHRPRPPSWAQALARGDTDILRILEKALRAYHDVAIEPYWERIQAGVDAQRAVLSRVALDGGVGRLLDSLHPSIRWSPPVLEADYPCDRDRYLDGRGLLLIPSYFCWNKPVSLRDPDLRPVLVFPIQRGPVPGVGTMQGGTALADLLGTTRAAALAAVGDGCSTGELAVRLGISPGTASRHATVLRDAGLTASTRHGGMVIHLLTPLGRCLLGGAR